MLQAIPSYDPHLDDENAITDIAWIKQLIVAVRTVRAEMNISPTKPLALLIHNADGSAISRVNANKPMLLAMAKLHDITLLKPNEKAPMSITKLIDGAELMLPMAGIVDKTTELTRLDKEINKLDTEIKRIESKLANENFISRAPDAVIAKEKEKLAAYQIDKEKLMDQYQVISKL